VELLSLSNTKTVKGQAQGYMTWILHLSPADSAGYKSVCPKASKGCKAGCLNYAGLGQTQLVQKGRQRKTSWFFDDRKSFMDALVEDVRRAINRAEKKGLIPVFRLNGTSDIIWERISVQGHANIFNMYPNYQFYDYTKILKRNVSNISNYQLTFSRSESNDQDCNKAIVAGMNVAVVFESLPERFMGLPVFNGDEDDLRFLDPKNVVVGLTAKGRARKDQTGFVVRKLSLHKE
jgi:hypothetical protein